MGDFRPKGRGNFGGRSGVRGNRGGFGGRGRSFGGDRAGGGRGGFGRRPLEMHEATCSKCGKRCQVPFRPSGGKPVFCSDCFEKNNPNNSFGPRNNGSSSLSSGMPQEQFNQINEKLDRILKLLEMVEIEEVDEDSKDEEESN